MRKLVAGNWKMNGSKSKINLLLKNLASDQHKLDPSSIELVVFPPFVYLNLAEEVLKNSSIAWGAQDVSLQEKNGAYTGQISVEMLKDFNCQYVLVGHSERRQQLKESDQEVAAKFHAALKNGLTPILCVGETDSERENKKTMSVIERQIQAVLDTRDTEKSSHWVIAYEPIWAIGTGKTATPEEAQVVHQKIREYLKKIDNKLASTTRIIYGGSVNETNASALCRMPEINGVLVGGASLEAKQFLEIGKQCSP